MTINFLTRIPQDFETKKSTSTWQNDHKKLKIKFTQDQILEDFIKDNKILSCKAINSQKWNLTFENTALIDLDSALELLIYTVDYRIEIDNLVNLIELLADYTDQYLYLSLNKFQIYSDIDRSLSSTDFDQCLIDYCVDAVKDKFSLLSSHYRIDDNGFLGNYVHPATQLFLIRC